MQIKQINIIIHPFFHNLAQAASWNETEIDKNSKKIMKNTFHSLGEIIKQTKSNKNQLFIFVPLADYKINDFKKQQKRFIEFAKKTLGDRFILTHENIGFTSNYPNTPQEKIDSELAKLKRKLDKFEFTPKIKLNLGGEYTNNCVITGGKRIQSILSKKQIKSELHFLKYNKNFSQAHDIYTSLLTKRPFKEFSKWRRKIFGKRKFK